MIYIQRYAIYLTEENNFRSFATFCEILILILILKINIMNEL